MIMRFRPANISLINRRHYLPRPRLTLSSKKQKQKPPQRFADVDRVTPYHFRVGDNTIETAQAQPMTRHTPPKQASGSNHQTGQTLAQSALRSTIAISQF
jgi:hypothetical protein